jgi:hypothetical protein
MVQIQSICQESGKTTSEVLQEALAGYLGRTDVESIVSVNKRLAALERKYQKLAQLVTDWGMKGILLAWITTSFSDALTQSGIATQAHQDKPPKFQASMMPWPSQGLRLKW